MLTTWSILTLSAKIPEDKEGATSGCSGWKKGGWGKKGWGRVELEAPPCARRLLQGILHPRSRPWGKPRAHCCHCMAGRRITCGLYLLSGLPAELVTRKCPFSGSSTNLERVLPPSPSTRCLGKTTLSNTGFIQAEKIEKCNKSVLPNPYQLRNVSDCIHVRVPWVMFYSLHGEKPSMTLDPRNQRFISERPQSSSNQARSGAEMNGQ